MDKVEIIDVKDNVLSKNEVEAEKVRTLLKEKKVFQINLMSSPGSGKTTLLCALIPLLTKRGYHVSVLEADIDGDVDAHTILEKTKAKSVQLHTMGACHLTAQMTYDALNKVDLDDVDVVFLENVGNLVCPAEFDTGSDLNMMLLAVPEGDDKPLKYPLMFQVSNYVLVTKMDVLPVFDFNFEDFKERVEKLNPNAEIFTVSSIKNEGVEDVAESLAELIEAKIQK